MRIVTQLLGRCLKALTAFAQLWHAYLQERQKAVRGLAITDPAVSSLNNTYERALVSMHKMPRIWVEYLVRPCITCLAFHICARP